MQIFITRGEDSSGPYTLEQVQDYLAQGVLLPGDLAYHEELEDWIPLSELVDSISTPESTPSAPSTEKPTLLSSDKPTTIEEIPCLYGYVTCWRGFTGSHGVLFFTDELGLKKHQHFSDGSFSSLTVLLGLHGRQEALSFQKGV